MIEQPPTGIATAPARLRPPSAVARGLGWLELCAAPLLVAAASSYRPPPDSGMGGHAWLYSLPAAAVFFALPGALLLTAPRLGWVAQILPVALAVWLALPLFMPH